MLINEDDSLDQIWEMVQLELQKGPSAKRHPFRFAVLSTIGREGPSSRWVVYRKYTDDSKLLIYTDARSEKCADLERNPNGNLLLYHDRQKLQIRIKTEATLHQQDELTAKYWPGVKGSNPNDYLSNQPPGKAIDDIEPGFERDAGLDDKYFTIIELDPKKMDVLQLNGDRHIRAEFEKQKDQWNSTFLVP